MKSNYGFYKIPDYSYEFYDPMSTFDGRKLSLVKDKKPNFSKARRFSQYDIDEKRIGSKVGPGTYNPDYLKIGSLKYTLTPLFCRFHRPINRQLLASNMQKNILRSARRSL